jgi:hypothetical protein
MNATRIVVAHKDITEVKRTHKDLAHLTMRLMQLQDDRGKQMKSWVRTNTGQIESGWSLAHPTLFDETNLSRRSSR